MRKHSLWQFDLRLFEGGPGVGVDEAGRGPLAGPVVACAVAFPGGGLSALSGLRDGKTLSHLQRKDLFSRARKLGVRWSLGWSSAEEIDRINILQASLLAMVRAVEGLEPPAGALIAIDGLYTLKLAWRQRTIIDGDAKSWSVTLAGVLAKVARDRWMERYDRRFPGYGLADNKGYGTEQHREALKKLGPCPIHRRSFAPVAEAAAPSLS